MSDASRRTLCAAYDRSSSRSLSCAGLAFDGRPYHRDTLLSLRSEEGWGAWAEWCGGRGRVLGGVHALRSRKHVGRVGRQKVSRSHTHSAALAQRHRSCAVKDAGSAESHVGRHDSSDRWFLRRFQRPDFYPATHVLILQCHPGHLQDASLPSPTTSHLASGFGLAERANCYESHRPSRTLRLSSLATQPFHRSHLPP